MGKPLCNHARDFQRVPTGFLEAPYKFTRRACTKPFGHDGQHFETIHGGWDSGALYDKAWCTCDETDHRGQPLCLCPIHDPKEPPWKSKAYREMLYLTCDVCCTARPEALFEKLKTPNSLILGDDGMCDLEPSGVQLCFTCGTRVIRNLPAGHKLRRWFPNLER